MDEIKASPNLIFFVYGDRKKFKNICKELNAVNIPNSWLNRDSTANLPCPQKMLSEISKARYLCTDVTFLKEMKGANLKEIVHGELLSLNFGMSNIQPPTGKLKFIIFVRETSPRSIRMCDNLSVVKFSRFETSLSPSINARAQFTVL